MGTRTGDLDPGLAYYFARSTSPTTPGSIHEGGELGYSLSHAFGAAFDNSDLIVACIIGDGEAETDPWPRRGSPTSCSIPSPTARSCRSCISTATKLAIQHCSLASSATSWSSFCAAVAGRTNEGVSPVGEVRAFMRASLPRRFDTEAMHAGTSPDAGARKAALLTE